MYVHKNIFQLQNGQKKCLHVGAMCGHCLAISVYNAKARMLYEIPSKDILHQFIATLVSWNPFSRLHFECMFWSLESMLAYDQPERSFSHAEVLRYNFEIHLCIVFVLKVGNKWSMFPMKSSTLIFPMILFPFLSLATENSKRS